MPVFEIGDVIWSDFKWPDKEKPEGKGKYERPCTIFDISVPEDGKGQLLHVVPHNGLNFGEKRMMGKERKREDPYSFKISRGLQSELGLIKKDSRGIRKPDHEQKDSWIVPYLVNKMPFPGNLYMAKRRAVDGQTSWTLGRVSQNYIEKIKERMERAKENGDYTEYTVPRVGGQGRDKRADKTVPKNPVPSYRPRDPNEPRRARLSARVEDAARAQKVRELEAGGYLDPKRKSVKDRDDQSFND